MSLITSCPQDKYTDRYTATISMLHSPPSADVLMPREAGRQIEGGKWKRSKGSRGWEEEEEEEGGSHGDCSAIPHSSRRKGKQRRLGGKRANRLSKFDKKYVCHLPVSWPLGPNFDFDTLNTKYIITN